MTGLEAGADEYLTKPVDQTSLVARVKSMLRVKELHDKIASPAADLAKWNKTLEERVADQLSQIERAGRLTTKRSRSGPALKLMGCRFYGLAYLSRA